MSRALFTAEEWTAVTVAPLHAAAWVLFSERGGSFKESLAVKRVYSAARELHGESALLDDLVAQPPGLDPKDIQPEAAPIQTAMSAVKAKAPPQDADHYKGFVLAVVQTVAEANREGGFAGLGGDEVSAREQAALDELTALLDR